MSVLLEERQNGKILDVNVSGKLEKEDYEFFVPEAEKRISEHGKIRFVFETTDFHGWEPSALWEDIKFDVKHFNDVEKVAVVGEKKWEKGMATFCKPFTSARVRFFEKDRADEAREWVASDD